MLWTVALEKGSLLLLNFCYYYIVISGAFVFGVGWALSGLCPAPSVVSIGRGDLGSLFSSLAMLAGFMFVELAKGSPVKQIVNVNSTLALGFMTSFGLIAAAVVGKAAPPSEVSMGLPYLGGPIIGFAVGLKMLLDGQVLGNSGTLKGLVTSAPNYSGRFLFLSGLLISGMVLNFVMPLPPPANPFGHGLTTLGGFLVGVGTAMANGCTSGHGIAGVSRFSKRSLAATGVFFL